MIYEEIKHVLNHQPIKTTFYNGFIHHSFDEQEVDLSNSIVRELNGLVTSIDLLDLVIRPQAFMFDRDKTYENSNTISQDILNHLTSWQDRPFNVTDFIDGRLLYVGLYHHNIIMTIKHDIDEQVIGYYLTKLKLDLIHHDQLELFKEKIKGKTLIFRAIDSDDVHTVDYQDDDAFVLVGMIENNTGYDYHFDLELKRMRNLFNFESPYVYKYMTDKNKVDRLMNTLNDKDLKGVVIHFQMKDGSVLRFKQYTNYYKKKRGLS